jgi:hypothetical protein
MSEIPPVREARLARVRILGTDHVSLRNWPASSATLCFETERVTESRVDIQAGEAYAKQVSD